MKKKTTVKAKWNFRSAIQ